MKRLVFPFLLFAAFLSACSTTSEPQGRNPKTANVDIGDGKVVITIPTSTPYFHLEKVADDSVEYSQIFFRYDSEADLYLIRTDLEDWQPYTAGEEPTQMGAATITVTEDDITISYPSGTWAFP
ncbi:MAG: hypothetical protein H6634_08125 [Anaerolineales bacterium]|nr:hypothetical protein [Anaerolineales bacterium]